MSYKNPEDEKKKAARWWANLPQEKRELRYARTAEWSKSPDGRKYHREKDRLRNKSPQRRLQDLKKNLKRKYHITLGEYEMILTAQDRVCSICKQENIVNGKKKRLAVDHNHATGFVRGLLCDSCNHALGELRDDPSLVAKALGYIQRGIGGDAHALSEA
jgi:hypothetical protein